MPYSEPFTDGDRVTSPDRKYDYRLRHSARFGRSISRFEKTSNNTVSYGSVTTIQRSQPTDKHKTLGAAEYEQRMTNTQLLLNELKTLQDIRRMIDSLVVSVQQSLKESSR